MAEIKRVALQSVDIGNQTSKKSEKTKQVTIAPSFRFVLNLPESNELTCPEFNYAQLLKNAEKKRKKKKEESGVSNGISSIDIGDDDEKVLDIARFYESKYGNRKKSDYVDLGAGYDESDSFIDNTDAYDELVPVEVTTEHGGFYVNSGPLEFKDSGTNGIRQNNVSAENENGNDDDEESIDEDSEDEALKRKRKRSLSSSDETEDISHRSKLKPQLDDAEYDIVD